MELNVKEKELEHIRYFLEWIMSIDIMVWTMCCVIIVLVWHLYNHKNSDIYSPIKKITYCVIFVGIVFITTLLRNLSLRDVMAVQPINYKNIQTNDLLSFYNNIIAYLSFAFVILSVVAYNSIKVLTEEKATKLILEKFEEKRSDLDRIIDDEIQEKFSVIKEELEILKGNIIKSDDGLLNEDCFDKVENVTLTVEK